MEKCVDGGEQPLRRVTDGSERKTTFDDGSTASEERGRCVSSDVGTETDIVLPCLPAADDKCNDDSNNDAAVEFWRLTASSLVKQMDMLRKSNVDLENSINNAKTELRDLEEVNFRLMEKLKSFESNAFSSDSSEEF